ncbi:MAG TPA: ABC transporter permease, partial [Blastocatellia bacterium]|nr:ABC transporter permease [Blastocatellia bacterium]
MDVISHELEQLYPATNQGWGVTLISLYEMFTKDVRPAMLLLTIAVWLLLIVACANVASLLLVRAGGRRREIAVRKALGATRGRLVQQFLAESAVLVLAGSVLGLALAIVGIRAFLAFSPGDIPRLQNAGIEVKTLGFSILVSLLTGLVFGLAPALHTAGIGLNEALKEGGRSPVAGTASRRTRSFLLIIEVAFAVMLLVGSVLLVRSFLNLRRVDPGFKPERVLTVQLILPRKKYTDPHQVVSFTRGVLQGIQSLPDAEAAAVATTIPLTGNTSVRDFLIAERPPLPAGKLNDAEFQVISPQFFRALGIPLLKGRLFNDLDNEDSTPVAIISDRMAYRYWPHEDPIGRQLTIGDGDGGPKLTVIGIVGDVRQSDLSLEPYPQLYVPFSQSPLWETVLVIKTQSEPSKIANEIRDRVASVDPDQPLYHVRPLTEIMSESISRQRFNSQLVGLLTLLALVLTVIGVYSVVSYLADQQLNDIGIRMALGARKKDVLTMIVWQGLSLVLIGVALGLGLALASTRLMSGLLFGVSASDPISYTIVCLLVATIAMAASYIPAARAAGIDPATVLRHE